MSPNLRRLLAALAGLASFLFVPRALVGRDADAIFDGELAALVPRADALATTIASGVGADDFHTGDARFDGEWALATHQMAILALAQILLSHPQREDLRARYLPAIRHASEILLSPSTRAFGTAAWGSDALLALDEARGRDAWLCYAALGLSMHREVDPHFPHQDLHDRILASLRRRITASEDRLIPTYPGETYPVDVSACVAAVAIRDRGVGEDPSAWVEDWEAHVRARYVDPQTHLLRQHVGGPPRGSGTGLAAYFLGLAGGRLSLELFTGLAAHERSLGGFSAIREYPDGYEGAGDVDSGPVLLGVSVSATGFTLAAARQHGARSLFVGLHRTAALFGVPYATSGATSGGEGASGEGFVTGGPIGDAILLAMETARRVP